MSYPVQNANVRFSSIFPSPVWIDPEENPESALLLAWRRITSPQATEETLVENDEALVRSLKRLRKTDAPFPVLDLNELLPLFNRINLPSFIESLKAEKGDKTCRLFDCIGDLMADQQHFDSLLVDHLIDFSLSENREGYPIAAGLLIAAREGRLFPNLQGEEGLWAFFHRMDRCGERFYTSFDKGGFASPLSFGEEEFILSANMCEKAVERMAATETNEALHYAKIALCLWHFPSQEKEAAAVQQITTLLLAHYPLFMIRFFALSQRTFMEFDPALLQALLKVPKEDFLASLPLLERRDWEDESYPRKIKERERAICAEEKTRQFSKTALGFE